MGRSFEGSFEMPRPQSIVQLHGLRQPQLRRPMPRRVRRQAARFAPSRWSGGPRSVARMPAVSSGVAAVIQPVAARDQSGDADCDVRQVRPPPRHCARRHKSQGRRWSSGVGTRDGIFSKRVVPATSPCVLLLLPDRPRPALERLARFATAGEAAEELPSMAEALLSAEC
jgi:hypothetical protein